MEEDQEFEGLAFEEVAAETPIPGSASREPKGGTFYKTGRFLTNVGGAEEIMLLVRDRGCDPENFRVSFGHNPGTDLVAIYARRHGEPGTADVRRNADGQTLTLYLHSLFEKYPGLRPVGTQKSKLSRSKDARGVPCLVFHAKGGLAKRTQSRDDGDSTGQVAAGQQK